MIFNYYKISVIIIYIYMYNIHPPSAKPIIPKFIISYNYPLKYKYYSIINSNNEIQLLYLPEMPIKPPFLLPNEPLCKPSIPNIISPPPGLDLSSSSLYSTLSRSSLYSTPPGLDLSSSSLYSTPPGLEVSSSLYSTHPGLDVSSLSLYSMSPNTESLQYKLFSL